MPLHGSSTDPRQLLYKIGNLVAATESDTLQHSGHRPHRRLGNAPTLVPGNEFVHVDVVDSAPSGQRF